jgi:hypothetical protein
MWNIKYNLNSTANADHNLSPIKRDMVTIMGRKLLSILRV